ncbi:MAG: hypothetical protein WA945_03390 [Arcobacteraceae bacterium]
MSNEHPVNNRFTFKDLIYKLTLIKIILIFLMVFVLFSMVFFALYSLLLSGENIQSFEIFKFSIYQSFGFDIDAIDSKKYNFEYISFLQQIISLVLNLIFTSSLILKYFNKPCFFQFKQKINIVDDYLIISLYNKTNFEINSASFKVYIRFPYKDNHGINSLNNIKIYPDRDFFPFMDQHLVTRIRINLKHIKNRILTEGTELHSSLLELLDVNKEFNDTQEIQNLRISILIDAMSPEIDNMVYEVFTYEINICDKENILQFVKYKKPNAIDIDVVDFAKSTGWENFED